MALTPFRNGPSTRSDLLVRYKFAQTRRNTVLRPHGASKYAQTSVRYNSYSEEVVISTMWPSEDFFLLQVFIYCLLVKRKRNKRSRSKWCKKWLLKRKTHSHINLMKDLREDPDDWRNYLRMDENAYNELLRLVTPIIQRQNTVMRECISPHERLSCTLRFLATGRSYRDLRFTAAISQQALSVIIPDTCRAIYMVLHKEYMKVSYTFFYLRYKNHFQE